MQSRVRVKHDSTQRCRESAEQFGYCDQKLSYDGRVVLQYSNSGRPRDMVERWESEWPVLQRVRSVSRKHEWYNVEDDQRQRHDNRYRDWHDVDDEQQLRIDDKRRD